MSLGRGTRVSLTHESCGRGLAGTGSVSRARLARVRPVDAPHAEFCISTRQPEVDSLADPRDREPFEYKVSFLRLALARGPPDHPCNPFSQKDLRNLLKQ